MTGSQEVASSILASSTESALSTNMTERPPVVLEIHERMGQILPISPTIIELGANTGQDTKLILKHCQGEYRYFAFEPDPYAAAEIEKQQLKVTLVKTAVSAQNGSAELFQGYDPKDPKCIDYTVFSSILRPTQDLYRFGIGFRTAVQVQTVRLDDFAAQHDIHHVDFMWVDIQGSEYGMIQGAQNILSNTNWLYIEVTDEIRYHGEKTETEVLDALPGQWRIDARLSAKDILLQHIND